MTGIFDLLIAYLINANADLKISLCVLVHIKIIPWKLRILTPKNSRVIRP